MKASPFPTVRRSIILSVQPTLRVAGKKIRAILLEWKGKTLKSCSRISAELPKIKAASTKWAGRLHARIKSRPIRVVSRAEIQANLRKRVTAPLVTARLPKQTLSRPQRPAQTPSLQSNSNAAPMPTFDAPQLQEPAGPLMPNASGASDPPSEARRVEPAPRPASVPPSTPKAITSPAIRAAASLRSRSTPRRFFSLSMPAKPPRATRPVQARQQPSLPKLQTPKLSLPRIALPSLKAIRLPKLQPRKSSRVTETARLPLGLDIGSAGIRWAQLSRQDGILRLTQLGYEQFPPDSVQAGEAPTTQRYARVRESIARAGLSGPTALSLSLDDSVRMRLVKMPPLPEAEIQQALRWQVEQMLPPDTRYEDLLVDHTFVDGIGAAAEPRVLIVTVPRARVDALLDSIRGTSLNPVAIELDPFAVQACLVWRHRIKPTETTLVLHLGAGAGYFSIIVGNEVAFSRSVLTTGRTLTQAVAENLQVAPDQAETLKQAHGLLAAPGMAPLPEEKRTPQALAVSQALASPMENLMVDIFHAFKGFSHQITQSQIQRFDRVFVDGGGTRLPGLIPWLQVRMGTPVEAVQPLEGLPLPEPSTAPANWENMAPHFSVAIGLAARELLQSP